MAPSTEAQSTTLTTDLPQAQVDELSACYRSEDACFARYLASLGLLGVDGTPKPAAGALRAGFD